MAHEMERRVEEERDRERQRQSERHRERAREGNRARERNREGERNMYLQYRVEITEINSINIANSVLLS